MAMISTLNITQLDMIPHNHTSHIVSDKICSEIWRAKGNVVHIQNQLINHNVIVIELLRAPYKF